MHNRRIAKIFRHDNGSYDVTFQEGWHDAKIFKICASDMDATIRDIACA